MESKPAVFLISLTMAFAAGCGTQSDKATESSSAQLTTASKLTNSPGKATLQSIADTQPLTEESLQAIEKRFSCKLPNDYREFLLAHNGAFPTPDCIMFEEAGRNTASDVFCFFAIHDDRAWASMNWHLEIYSNRLPKNALPIGRDSGGNLWLLSFRNDDAGSIYFWDHGAYDTFDETDLDQWPKVASSFQEFRDLLSIYNSRSEVGEVPSRYSFVKRAVNRMVEQHPDFSTRDNPGFVWHYDCDEDGKVNLQFVQYEAHAITSHTCGYNRLCAIKGLVEGGQTRLPE